jgi:hypothetical protein
MADWDTPALTDTYTNFLTYLKDRDTDLALMFDGTSSTNVPTDAIGFNASNNRFEKYNGASWDPLTFNVYGSAASGGDLILYSTSHATPGKIYLGSNSYYDEANDLLFLTNATNDIVLKPSNKEIYLSSGDNDSEELRMNYSGYNGGTTRFRDFGIYDGKNNRLLFVDGSVGAVGIGTSGPDAKLDILSTTEQLRLTYTDGGVYSSFTVDSAGDLTIGNSGSDVTITNDLIVSSGITLTNALIASGGIQTDGTNTLKTKVIDIGDWNMDGFTSATVTHGLTLSNILTVSVMIRTDTGTNQYKLNRGVDATDASPQGFVDWISTTNIRLFRLTGGFFDGDALFDATSYNRGWITITYIA